MDYKGLYGLYMDYMDYMDYMIYIINYGLEYMMISPLGLYYPLIHWGIS
jgi:hypothetical protein